MATAGVAVPVVPAAPEERVVWEAPAPTQYKVEQVATVETAVLAARRSDKAVKVELVALVGRGAQVVPASRKGLLARPATQATRVRGCALAPCSSYPRG